MSFIIRIISKIIILLLAIYCISVIVGFFVGYSLTFPFSFIEGRYVPEQRLHAIRLATLGTFFYFSIYYLFFGSTKLYPIQFMGIFLFFLGFMGSIVIYKFQLPLSEYFVSIFFLLASIVLYQAGKPEFRSYFRRK